ncbi:hypothetical protein BTO09_13385 [Gilvibacter sp. SZ-19]|uniref:hypothetical protein n=1 Tax=Gilvibacter sp. SZ-19 TaxID=754429 RepID=UPI000B3D2164|nr:hypothetical protein [Gilvibacter sp. SZ-19]ARV13270.1 hypothetical protein BTO09_13385 [Gilvibacter sp. SZ-19]
MFKSSLTLGFLAVFLLGQQALSLAQINEQVDNSYQRRLEIGLSSGYYWLQLGDGSALNLNTNALNPTGITLQQEALGGNQKFDQTTAGIGLFANYIIVKDLSIGLEWTLLQDLDYHESAFLTQAYFVNQGQLKVKNSGRYSFSSNIDLHRVLLNFQWSALSILNRKQIQLAMVVNVGAGPSFYFLNNSIKDAFLSLDVVSPNATGSFRLGPGTIKQETFIEQSWSWRVGGGFTLKTKFLPGIHLGAYYDDFGSFVQQPAADATLFTLSSVNTGSPEQVISIDSADSSRKLSAFSFLIKIFAW